jgi:hypothetical protein
MSSIGKRGIRIDRAFNRKRKEEENGFLPVESGCSVI